MQFLIFDSAQGDISIINNINNMLTKLTSTIEELNDSSITEARKKTLQPLIEYIQNKVENSEAINLNFICTHNSRRSHLSQIWAQTMATFFNIKNVHCYSGGTEVHSNVSNGSQNIEQSRFSG